MICGGGWLCHPPPHWYNGPRAKGFVLSTPEDMADKTLALIKRAYMDYMMHDWQVYCTELGYGLLHSKVPNEYISELSNGIDKGLSNE